MFSGLAQFFLFFFFLPNLFSTVDLSNLSQLGQFYTRMREIRYGAIPSQQVDLAYQCLQQDVWVYAKQNGVVYDPKKNLRDSIQACYQAYTFQAKKLADFSPEEKKLFDDLSIIFVSIGCAKASSVSLFLKVEEYLTSQDQSKKNILVSLWQKLNAIYSVFFHQTYFSPSAHNSGLEITIQLATIFDLCVYFNGYLTLKPGSRLGLEQFSYYHSTQYIINFFNQIADSRSCFMQGGEQEEKKIHVLCAKNLIHYNFLRNCWLCSNLNNTDGLLWPKLRNLLKFNNLVTHATFGYRIEYNDYSTGFFAKFFQLVKDQQSLLDGFAREENAYTQALYQQLFDIINKQLLNIFLAHSGSQLINHKPNFDQINTIRTSISDLANRLQNSAHDGCAKFLNWCFILEILQIDMFNDLFKSKLVSILQNVTRQIPLETLWGFIHEVQASPKKMSPLALSTLKAHLETYFNYCAPGFLSTFVALQIASQVDARIGRSNQTAHGNMLSTLMNKSQQSLEVPQQSAEQMGNAHADPASNSIALASQSLGIEQTVVQLNDEKEKLDRLNAVLQAHQSTNTFCKFLAQDVLAFFGLNETYKNIVSEMFEHSRQNQCLFHYQCRHSVLDPEQDIQSPIYFHSPYFVRIDELKEVLDTLNFSKAIFKNVVAKELMAYFDSFITCHITLTSEKLLSYLIQYLLPKINKILVALTSQVVELYGSNSAQLEPEIIAQHFAYQYHVLLEQTPEELSQAQINKFIAKNFGAATA